MLCIQGFRGKGYNEEFVENMKQIINHIESNRNVQIKIMNSADYICLSCPNNSGENIIRKFEIGKTYEDKGYCRNEDYIINLDNMVLDTLNIEAESEHSYQSLLEQLKQTITEDRFKVICGDCQWYSLGYCSEGIFGN